MVSAAPGPSYRRYRLRHALLFVFFVAYALTAVAGNLFSERGEFFPVFSWSLFSRSSDRVTNIEVWIHRIGDRRFEPPVRYSSLKADFPRAGNANTLKTVGRFVDGMRLSAADAETRRRVAEAQLFGGNPDIDYEIRITLFVPLERWHDGSVLGHRVLGRYTTGEEK